MKKIRGSCEICRELIVLGDLTKHKSGKYLCAKCQIDMNRKIDFKEILRHRRKEIMYQLSEIDVELNIDKNIGYI